MKIKNIITVLAFALLPLSAFAWGVVSISGGVAASAGLTCTTSDDSAILSIAQSGATDSVIATGYKSQEIVFTAETRITQYTIRCYDVNGTGNMVVSLRANSGNLPTGDDIENSVVTEAAASIQGDPPEDHAFVLATPITVSAGTYHVIAHGTGTDPQFYWQYATDNPYTSGSSGYSSDGTNWSENTGGDAGVDRRCIIMGCQ